jgi:hypothetical protein
MAILDPNESELQQYLSGIQDRIMQAVKLKPEPPRERDKEEAYFCTPAPNAIEWAVRKEFLNNPTTYRHWRQYQVIRDFFQLYCPVCNPMDPQSIDVWNKTQLELEGQVLLTWNNSEQDDVCPKCRSTRQELVSDGMLKEYNQLHAVVGMRGGKTATASIVAAYLESRIINVGHSHPGGLAGYFEQLPGQPFEVTFVASTEVQSADTIWAHYLARRNHSPWIQRYVSWIKTKQNLQANKDQVKPLIYQEHDKVIVNDFLGVMYNSLNSNSGGMAGRTRIGDFLDELSRFDNSDSKRSADEAYRVLEHSLRTVRSSVIRLKRPIFFGLMCSVSSPISIADKSMRLLKQSPELKHMYAIHYPTWGYNPFEPRENFVEEFIKDPLGAKRDFGAEPPNAANPLIEDPELFRKSVIDPNLKPTAMLDYYVHLDKAGNQYSAVKMHHAQMIRNAERYVVFDAGAAFDSFAGAAAHGEWMMDPDGEKNYVTVFDWVMRILPCKMPRREVWFDSVVALMDTYKKYQRVARVEFDRWNGAMLIQKLRDMSFVCDHVGTVVNDFLRFAADTTLGRIRMLPPGPNDDKLEPHQMSAEGTAFYEIERLQRSEDLKKVFNPKKGQRIGWDSDDVAQVVVHAHSMVQQAIAPSVGMNPHSIADRLKLEEMGSAKYTNGQLFRGRGFRGW